MKRNTYFSLPLSTEEFDRISNVLKSLLTDGGNQPTAGTSFYQIEKYGVWEDIEQCRVCSGKRRVRISNFLIGLSRMVHGHTEATFEVTIKTSNGTQFIARIGSEDLLSARRFVAAFNERGIHGLTWEGTDKEWSDYRHLAMDAMKFNCTKYMVENYKYRHRHAWFAIEGDAGDEPRVELQVQFTRREAAALLHVLNVGIRSEEAGEDGHIARVYRDFIDQAGKAIPAKR